MNTISKIATASFVALALASPVMAQGNAQPDNYGTLISTLQAGATVDLGTLTETSTVNFVTVSSVKANGNTQALDNALTKNAEAATALQAQVEANAVLKAKLTAAGYTSSQVIAINTAADGSLTVFVDDRA